MDRIEKYRSFEWCWMKNEAVLGESRDSEKIDTSGAKNG